MKILEIEKVIKRYPSPEGGMNEVVNIESFDIEEGEQTALAGESGSGKTTFLNLIAGILRADAGRIVLAGTDLESLTEGKRDQLRARTLGYIFQTFNLLQGYTAVENVMLGMMFGPGADRKAAISLLERVGLKNRIGYLPRQLSVGQQQRVAVARALANRPKLVLADEPTGHLDYERAMESLRLIKDICREKGAALLLVSHDRDVLASFQSVKDLSSINIAEGMGGKMFKNIRNLLSLVGHSLKQHTLSAAITVLSVAMAVGLTMSVFSLQYQTRNAFIGGNMGFDAVLGARGSQLQLVLNSVYHLETSPGNIPWSLYQAVKSDPRVALAVPYAVGDNFQGYRIVGTTAEIFSKFEYQTGRRFTVRPGGRNFDPAKKEAVIGSYVADKTGLKEGSEFKPYHGLYFDPKMQHEEIFTITGVLKPTNTPSDRVIWIPLEGVYRMKGHVLRGSGTEYTAATGAEIPDSVKEISSVMLKLYSPQAGFMLDQTINRQGKVATLAWPIGRVMAEFFDKLGWVSKVLTLVAYLVMLVAAAAILASLYNTMNERRREFAILRALGARRLNVFSSIVLEAAVIAGLGSLCGCLVYLAIFIFASFIIRQQTGVVLDAFGLHFSLIMVPVGMTLLGALSGFIPAIKAYSTDVAKNLDPMS